jgi:signal transduction histidine kinase
MDGAGFSIRRAALPAGVAAVTSLLLLLATLQHQWLGQVSEAERERLRAGARRAADEFAHDFDRQVARAWAWLQVDADTLHARAFSSYAERRERWRSLARHPEMLRDVYLIEPRAAGPPLLQRFDPDQRSFVKTEWPDAFREVRERVALPLRSADTSLSEWRSFADPVTPSIPGLLIPTVDLRAPVSQPPRPQERRGPRVLAFTLIAFDLEHLRERVLPDAAQRLFGDVAEPAFYVTVTNERSRPPLFDTVPARMASPAPPDVVVRLFGFRPEEGIEERFRITGAGGGSSPAGPPRRPRPRFGRDEEGHWTASLRLRGGSIDEVVEQARRRNLGVSFGVLALLGITALLLALSAQRNRRLVEQQMAFVAGVSHELRTPVAVIATSAANLADGVAREPEQVKRYGAVIQKECRRLAEMVSQVLEFASPAVVLSKHPVDLAVTVAEAAAATEQERTAADMSLSVRLDPTATRVLGDAAALRRAVENLLTNAAKYGGQGTIVEVTSARAGDSVVLSVADHGPGVPESERERIFEPFYRGRQAVAGQIRGNGLGLSLVRRIAVAHGGKVELETSPGHGSRFLLRLPAPAAAPIANLVGTTDAQQPQANPSR